MNNHAHDVLTIKVLEATSGKKMDNRHHERVMATLRMLDADRDGFVNFSELLQAVGELTDILGEVSESELRHVVGSSTKFKIEQAAKHVTTLIDVYEKENNIVFIEEADMPDESESTVETTDVERLDLDALTKEVFAPRKQPKQKRSFFASESSDSQTDDILNAIRKR